MTQAVWPIQHPAETPVDLPTAPDINPEAFAAQYRTHFRAIAGYLYRRTGDYALAEDLAAETFLSAWKALPRYRPTDAPFKAWLLRIATNHANAAARRDRTRLRAFRRLIPGRAPAEHRPDTDPLLAALARLGPHHQSVISLVHLEELTVQQAARVLDVPEGTVKSRLLRARQALKRELARAGGDP